MRRLCAVLVCAILAAPAVAPRCGTGPRADPCRYPAGIVRPLCGVAAPRPGTQHHGRRDGHRRKRLRSAAHGRHGGRDPASFVADRDPSDPGRQYRSATAPTAWAIWSSACVSSRPIATSRTSEKPQVSAASSRPVPPPASRSARTNSGSGPQLAVAEQDDFDRALAAFEAGDYAAASAAFMAFTQTYPGGPLSAEAHFMRGEAEARQNAWSAAARAYLESFSAAAGWRARTGGADGAWHLSWPAGAGRGGLPDAGGSRGSLSRRPGGRGGGGRALQPRLYVTHDTLTDRFAARMGALLGPDFPKDIALAVSGGRGFHGHAGAIS